MIGIPINRDNTPKKSKEELFASGLTYIGNKEYAFAYHCLSCIENPDIYVLYNMAYCCYCIFWYEQSYSLLKDAETKLPYINDISINQLPMEFQRWEQNTSDTISPMPANTFPWMLAIQFFRLKAVVASKLQLNDEVRRISSYLGGKFNNINKLINQ